ncbi:hypothetical protein E1I69_11905 [Bacillus timonensis]|uniref:Histone deacetylase n=1 Tax=Bacillus timonensis TaxID=1033734 RepID=A0A4S3PRB1_9BACI|nr:hypothetical protein [Bacillus timonensis]THE12217.1 hypothetical protein E1I69_11905 [Bacillus timonensis]
MKQYIWYASYGSNINRDRFLCYIKGGRPKGSTETEVGCKDPSSPIDEGMFTIPYPLYFAKEAGRWDSKGVAFIDGTPNDEAVTYSKKYLITSDQFLDVLQQENSGLQFDIDLQKVKESGSTVFRKKAWYGRILYLGDDSGYPIFTFTAPWNADEVPFNKPSMEYLETIITGLKEYKSNEDIIRYLEQKPGIKGNYTTEELTKLV